MPTGPAIVTEDGTEVQNVFSNNISIRVQGDHIDGKSGTDVGDYGRGGSGFWFHRGGNLIVNNVAADNTFAGFVFDGYFTADLTLPLYRGVNKHLPGMGVTGGPTPITLFVGNEAYGMTRFGVWAAFVNVFDTYRDQPKTIIYNLRLWHIYDTGIFAYHTSGLTIDRLVLLADEAAQNRNDFGTIGLDFSLYESYDVVVRNSRIEGARTGIKTPRNDATLPGVERPTTISNSTLKNRYNIVVSPPIDNRPSGGNVVEVRNVKFERRTSLPSGPAFSRSLRPAANIDMLFSGENINWTQTSIVRVYDYNQVPGDDFQVFYREQAASYLLPQTSISLLTHGNGVIGVPAANVTNDDAWRMYNIATAGAVAPAAAASTHPEINGLVAAIQPIAQTPPRVVLVTPWNNALVVGDNLRIRYNIVGVLPAGARVYFQLDSGPRFTDAKVDYPVASGQHVLWAYIGDADGKRLLGTPIVNSTLFAF